MENLRLFLGIALPEPVESALGRIAAGMKPALSFRKWTHPADYHITLHYLGNMPPDKLHDIRLAAREAARRAAPIRLSLAAPGTFGPLSAPRVLWCGIDEANDDNTVAGTAEADPALSPLHQLHLLLGERLRERIGYQPESRPYHPHITLARSCEGDRCANAEIVELWHSLASREGELHAVWPGSAIAIFRSHLDRTPYYERLDSIPLSGPS
ncbi:RNA 2',3'-cyclic phosphodiesterase [Cohnella rhizosphaerae]|uniref:RNA 2',3'-cyclic phosphodiesterase n=1 Tax=Cohnella rhizosphaerae TaxID=1457232 RepID=A0A9X4KRB4_9BACL|nr:RNA 2',3'-cyclic phosphodiesterase [Cohnella rhizosphaerae]MDG0808786.1 RNA 2',3'-cyclic phosphodiesterase [Cohnella rhizosphaerae]